MITRFETLGPQATIGDAAELLLRTTQHEFPVVDGAGKLRGVADPQRHGRRRCRRPDAARRCSRR